MRLSSTLTSSTTLVSWTTLAIIACGVFADLEHVSNVRNPLGAGSEVNWSTGSNEDAGKQNKATVMFPTRKMPIRSTEKRQVLARTGPICRNIQVVAGDGCWSLSKRCGISQQDLSKFNPVTAGSDFCGSIKVGQHVCCSSGSLPDVSPQPNPDGSCFAYAIRPGDVCQTIADSHQTTTARIENVNNNTWGWEGCSHLMPSEIICLSTGDPPMPAAVVGAQCGPQVPGTAKPKRGTTLADLNPCPLNACCDVWGQCGITATFCTRNPADSGAPGTAKPGSNGCISNCGMQITNNFVPPARVRRVGYFEAWNGDRQCLHMSPANIDTTLYTHVHYAFGPITHDFHVNVSAHQDVFHQFVSLTGINRILSFGGWSFSTDADTFPIFRTGVSDAERSLFATNVAQFIVQNNLDGVDFDWEYPGAPDIPGLPPGSPADGLNYLAFLKLVRAALPSGKSVSIAAPASYWYLKGFPIKDISDVVDYIIYMTYDLNGQWNYGHKNAMEGCPDGNCLRSHVNMTETTTALAMITKAGVPANKVVVGMAKYGRSFQMSKAGCHTADCTFTGPASGAWPGSCTATAGYISNYEINRIITEASDPVTYNTTIQMYSDEGDILVYDDTQWISYMSETTYSTRNARIVNSLFGGTSDWAVDLDKDYSTDPTGDSGIGDFNNPPCDYSVSFDTLDALQSAAGQYPVYCAEVYTVQTLSKELDTSLAAFNDVNNGYDTLFGYYVTYIKDMIQPTLDQFMFVPNGPGNKYFDCTWFSNGFNRTTHTCPFTDLEIGAGGSYDLFYTLKDSAGFFKELSSSFGIDPTWVKFSDKDYSVHCTASELKNGCIPIRSTSHGFPVEADNVKVPNPKDAITAAGPNMSGLSNKIDATWMDQMFGQWSGSGLDAVQVLALPVAMVQQAVESMKQVKAIGQTEEAAKRKELILTIITVVLAVVPFVGDAAAAAAGPTDLARAIVLIGEATNDAFTLYSIVGDPQSAPMAIFGMILGVGALGRDEASFLKLGAMRRDMSAADLSRMGKIFSDQSAKIQKIVRSCKM